MVELYHSAPRTHSVGICASGLKCFLGAHLFWGDAHRKGYCQVHDIHGLHLSPHCYPIAIDMLAKGLLPMDQILTHRLPLENFHEGIDLVAAGDRSIKVSLTP